MGKLIMCSGKIAKHPIKMKSTNTLIYSMEELCYYIYHNIDTIAEDLICDDLIPFMRDELGLEERALFIEKLIYNKASLKDIIVSIFCSADYYSEEEIKHFLAQMDAFLSLGLPQRKKRHADYCFKDGQYSQALREYQMLLNSKESQELSHCEYGDVLHNIAVIEARSGAFLIAAKRFLDAYERNERKESLKQYLYALKFGKQEEKFNRELNHLLENQKSLYDEIEKELYHVLETEEFSEACQELRILKDLNGQEQTEEYHKVSNHIIENIKQRYRARSI